MNGVDKAAQAYATAYTKYAACWFEAVEIVGAKFFGQGSLSPSSAYIDELAPNIVLIASNLGLLTDDCKVLAVVMVDLWGCDLTEYPLLAEYRTARAISKTNAQTKKLISRLFENYPINTAA